MTRKQWFCVLLPLLGACSNEAIDRAGDIAIEMDAALVKASSASNATCADDLEPDVRLRTAMRRELARMHGLPVLRDEAHRSPVALAIMADDPDAMNRFIADGYSLENASAMSDPVTLAVQYGSDQALAALLARGLEPDVGRDLVDELNYDTTPLTRAVSAGRVETVRLLIGAGAEVDSETDVGRRLLRSLRACKNPEIARMLVEAGLPADAVAKELATPLPGRG